jgi:hypothetical protein
LLVARQAGEKAQLDDLLERRRGVVENQQSLLRGAQRDKLGDQSKLDEVERDCRRLGTNGTRPRAAIRSHRPASRAPIALR